jgi:hypothetical protein
MRPVSVNLAMPNRTIFAADIISEDVGAAVQHGLTILDNTQTHDPSAEAVTIEIWQDAMRVFPPAAETLTPLGSGQVPGSLKVAAYPEGRCADSCLGLSKGKEGPLPVCGSGGRLV